MVRFSRRHVLAAMAGLWATAGSARAISVPEPAPAPGRLMALRRTHLYVEDWGDKAAPALLYLHGGPGAGSYDFSLYQGPRLAKALRVVILDQRGVLRSDRAEFLTMKDLVEDCEALRQALGIRRWTLVGHSFGGQLALRYATAYPHAIAGVAFENPSLDVASSIRSLLTAAAPVFDAHDAPTDATAARGLAAGPMSAGALWRAFGQISGKLGAWREEIYVHQPALRGFYERLMKRGGFTAEQLGRAAAHSAALTAEGKLFDDVTPLLARMNKPALMMRGDFDAVTAPYQMRAFGSGPRRAVSTFHESAHFIHVEEPDAYAARLTDFAVQASHPGR